MHRFYIPPEESGGPTLVLHESEARHARQVLRVGVGDGVIVLDGAGQELAARVTRLGKDWVEVAVIERRVRPRLAYRVTLLQGITKGPSMDWIVEKATELGVTRLVPVVAERSVPRFGDEGEGVRRAAKWRMQAIEAIKQCGSAWLPEIAAPMGVKAAVASSAAAAGLRLVASLEPGARHPRTCLGLWAAEHGDWAREVAVWVGPEGDFTPAELEIIRGSGAWPITLGPLVLRSETAAIYCLSVLAYELQATR